MKPVYIFLMSLCMGLLPAALIAQCAPAAAHPVCWSQQTCETCPVYIQRCPLGYDYCCGDAWCRNCDHFTHEHNAFTANAWANMKPFLNPNDLGYLHRMQGWYGTGTRGAGLCLADVNLDKVLEPVSLLVNQKQGVTRSYLRISSPLGYGDTDLSELCVTECPFPAEGTVTGADLAVTHLGSNDHPDFLLVQTSMVHGKTLVSWSVASDLSPHGNPKRWFGPYSFVSEVKGQPLGCGAATALVNDNARPDLILITTTRVKGEIQAWYRIGWDLGIAGEPSAGWSEEHQLPGDWSESQRDIALTAQDLDGNGLAELLLLCIRDPFLADEAYAFYRMGWNLSPSGAFLGGWTFNTQLPDNLVGSCGIGGSFTQADDDPRPDLVLFNVHGSMGVGDPDEGFYQIIRNLGPPLLLSDGGRE